MLGHYGTMWARISTHGPFIHTAFTRRPPGRERDRADAGRARRRARLDPRVGAPLRLRRDRRRRQRRRAARRPAVARQPHARPRRPVPRHPRAADDGDDRRARRVRRRWCASCASAIPDAGITSEVYVTAPGAQIDESHPLIAAIDAGHEQVFGAPPARDTVRWFSDASALTRYGIETVNYGTSSGLPDPDGENLEIAGLRDIAAGLRARRRATSAGRPREARHLRDRRRRPAAGRSSTASEIASSTLPDMRTLFERGLDPAAAARGRRARRARRRPPARADHPEEVLPHLRQLPRARGGVEGRRLVARDRAVDRLLPERRRDHRPRRADHLPRAPDRRARPRARARRDHRQSRASTSTRDEAASYIAGYTIFNDITARDIQRREMRSGVFSFCKAIDTLLPARPVDRHPRRGRRPARPRRCACASTASCARSPTRATCR